MVRTDSTERRGEDHAGDTRRRERSGWPASRPHGRTGTRRRRADRRAIAGSALAVLALVGCVMAILMLATAPTAARLEREIGALSRRLDADQHQLAGLREAAVRDRAVHRRLTITTGRLTGLARTVHGLQTATADDRAWTAGLQACVPQLQRELAGLAVETRQARGRVIGVGLRRGTLLSAPCQALLGGF